MRIRVTVKKVELKQTVIENKTKTEHKRHHKGGVEKTSEEIVTKETNVAAVNFITGYQIIAENREDSANKIEKVIKSELPQHPVDYLRKAISFTWSDDNKITKINFKELDSKQI